MFNENNGLIVYQVKVLIHSTSRNYKPWKFSFDKQNGTLKSNIHTIVGVAKRIHIDQIEAERDRTNDDIRLLQMRILERQEEFREYEAKMKKEMDSTVMHLDHLPETFPEIKILRPGRVEYVEKEPIPTMVGIPLKDEDLRHKHRRKENYSKVKDTNEVLRCAFNELCREQKQINTLHHAGDDS